MHVLAPIGVLDPCDARLTGRSVVCCVLFKELAHRLAEAVVDLIPGCPERIYIELVRIEGGNVVEGQTYLLQSLSLIHI